MKVERIKKAEKKKLAKLKSLVALKEYSFLFSQPDINKNANKEYNFFELKNSDEILIAKKGKKIFGYATLRALPWDTKHFGMKMANFKVKSLAFNYKKDKEIVSLLTKEAIKNSKIKHFSIKINPFQIEEIHALQDDDFYFVGCNVSYILNLNKFDAAGYTKFSSVNIRIFKKSDTAKVKKIALRAFGNRNSWLDRFHADPNLNKKKSDELYAKWAVNCCRGKTSDIMIVAEKGKKVIGFTGAKTERDASRFLGKKLVRVVLNAVEKEYRNQGVYRQLTQHLLSILKAKNVDYVIIATQLTTKAVARVWMGLGAKMDFPKIIFHKFIG